MTGSVRRFVFLFANEQIGRASKIKAKAARGKVMIWRFSRSFPAGLQGCAGRVACFGMRFDHPKKALHGLSRKRWRGRDHK